MPRNLTLIIISAILLAACASASSPGINILVYKAPT